MHACTHTHTDTHTHTHRPINTHTHRGGEAHQATAWNKNRKIQQQQWRNQNCHPSFERCSHWSGSDIPTYLSLLSSSASPGRPTASTWARCGRSSGSRRSGALGRRGQRSSSPSPLTAGSPSGPSARDLRAMVRHIIGLDSSIHRFKFSSYAFMHSACWLWPGLAVSLWALVHELVHLFITFMWCLLWPGLKLWVVLCSFIHYSCVMLIVTRALAVNGALSIH